MHLLLSSLTFLRRSASAAGTVCAAENLLVPNIHLLCCLLTLSLASPASAREWFVRTGDASASDSSGGSTNHPFRTINAAAQLAQPGDVVTVGPGIYHEWISPARGGNANAPIRYRSLPAHAAIVRGSDVLVADWQPMAGAPGVFTAPLPKTAFLFFNPFARPPSPPKDKPEWLGKCDALVFHHDQPLLQVSTREQLMETNNSWLSSDDGRQVMVHLEGSSAPGKNAIEITTRDRIFAPHRRGLGYIEVEGFVFERCACRPSWPQLGALSTRTGDHWTIRNNIVRDTTGKGIDCGSETWSPDTLLDTENSDKRILIGGHHLIEGNLLTGNAECGIAAWNTESVRIVGNKVCGNAARGSEKPVYFLADAEAAGIKVHAFRHGLIEGNLVASNSSFGIWLDNGWENARVTRNVSIANRGAGIFVELGFGPAVVDHNLSAANVRLWPPYLGDGIYCHDASGVTIAHNTLIENAHFGMQALVVTERSYASRRLAEASDLTITGNLFTGNHDADISLPLDSPRSRFNHSDNNAFPPDTKFIINNNERRISVAEIQKSCRLQLEAAHVPENERPNLSDSNSLPVLSLAAWRVVMQMDQGSKLLPDKFRAAIEPSTNGLELDLASFELLSRAPGGLVDDFDLPGEVVKAGEAPVGAIAHVQSGRSRLWPLPAVARPTPIP